MPAAALAPVEFLILLVAQALFSGGGLLGVPPAERDIRLVRAAPEDSFLYAEWSGRSSGKEGAAGVDGLLADPEIRALLTELDSYMESQFGEGDVDPSDPLFSKPGYDVLKRLMMRPGCLYARLDGEAARKEGEGGKTGLAGPAELRGVEAALVVNAGQEVETVEADLVQLLNSQNEDSEVASLDQRELPSTQAGLKLVLHRHKEYLILGVGDGTAKRIIARLDGSAPGIDGNSRYQSSVRAVVYDRFGSVAWIDLETFLRHLKNDSGPRGVIAASVLETLGLGSVRSIASATGVVEGEIQSRIRVETDGKLDGLLAAFAGRGLVPADLQHIPADADFVWAASFSPAKTFAAIKEIARKADPSVLKLVEDGLKQLQEDSGISVEDAVSAFGDVWTLHNAPSQGSALLSGGIVSIEVKDAKKAAALIDRLQSLVAALLTPMDAEVENAAHFAEEEFLGRRISILVAEGSGSAISPAFCLTDRHLCVALNPQVLKAMVRQSKGRRESFATHWNKFGDLPEGEPILLTWVDSQAWLKTVAAILPYWAKEMADISFFEGQPFNLFHVPSFEALRPFVTPAVGQIVRTKSGFLSQDRGGLPSPGGASLLWKLLLWMQESDEAIDF